MTVIRENCNYSNLTPEIFMATSAEEINIFISMIRKKDNMNMTHMFLVRTGIINY